MNTKVKKNGMVVRERIIKWKNSNGRIQQHRVKVNPSSKQKKSNNPNDTPKSKELKEIGTELGYNGSETVRAARQNQVSSVCNIRQISHSCSISHSSTCFLIGVERSQTIRKHCCSTKTLDPLSDADAMVTWHYSNVKHVCLQVLTVLVALPDSTCTLLFIASLNGLVRTSRMFMRQKLDSASKCHHTIRMGLFVIHAIRFKHSLSSMSTVSMNFQSSSVRALAVTSEQWIFNYSRSSSSLQV